MKIIKKGDILRSLETSKMFDVEKDTRYVFMSKKTRQKQLMFQVHEVGKRGVKLVPDIFFAETWRN